MIVYEFKQFGGQHTEVCALKNTLKQLAVVAPHTGQPYTEELLFGIGGGIGFAYFLFEKSGLHPIHLGTRIHTKETDKPDFLQMITSRIGARLRLQNSSSSTAAAANLKRQLADGHTPIVFVDPVRLPYLGLNAALHTYYSVVVCGIDEQADRVLISDRCPQPVTVTQQELRFARETSWSPKYRAVMIEKPDQEPDLGEALTAGIADCCRQLNEGLGITNFGIRGMEKWATVLTSSKEKKSWPKIFPPGQTLYEALYSIFAQITSRSVTGNALRGFYAAFLDEAAEALSNPGLRQSAELYRQCDRLWGEVADAHLPSSNPLFAEAKDLTLRRRDLFQEKGTDATAEIVAIRERLMQIDIEASTNFPLNSQDSRALMNDLKQRIGKLREAELQALRSVEAAMGPSFNASPPQPQVVEDYEKAVHDEVPDAQHAYSLEMNAGEGAY